MSLSTAIIINPDEIECVLQFSMKLKDWKQIKKTLNEHPAYVELQIINEIQDLTTQLEKTLYANTTPPMVIGDVDLTDLELG